MDIFPLNMYADLSVGPAMDRREYACMSLTRENVTYRPTAVHRCQALGPEAWNTSEYHWDHIILQLSFLLSLSFVSVPHDDIVIII